MTSSAIKIALVVDDSTDESGIQVIDVVSVEPLGDNRFIVETKPFRDVCLSCGVGVPFDQTQALAVARYLTDKFKLKDLLYY